jgi:hypothetical protein
VREREKERERELYDDVMFLKTKVVQAEPLFSLKGHRCWTQNRSHQALAPISGRSNIFSKSFVFVKFFKVKKVVFVQGVE